MGTSGSKGVAVVTGASRGLGREVVRALSKEGYAIGACSRGPMSIDVKATWPDDLHPGGLQFSPETSTLWSRVDVRDYQQIPPFVRQVEKDLGPVGVLVNNAGVVHPRKPVQEIRHEDFDPAFETHFTGPLGFIEAVLPGMLERNSGVIVNVASKAARYAVPGFAAYNASKAALVSLTQTLAKEVRGTGVRVYSVSPGGMRTEMREAAYGEEDAEKQQDPAFVAEVIKNLVVEGVVREPRWAETVIIPGEFSERKVPSGADMLVWHGVRVYPMEELR